MLERDDQSYIDDLVETLKEHCPNIAQADERNEQLKWFASAIVNERKQAVTALKPVEGLKQLRKISELLVRLSNQIDELPREARNAFETCIPPKSVEHTEIETVAYLEKALGIERTIPCSSEEFNALLRATSNRINSIVEQEAQKHKRRSDLDWEAVVVYRICLKVWRAELQLEIARGNQVTRYGGKTTPNKFPQPNYENRQDAFVQEVFDTFDFKTNIATAAIKLADLGGEEKLAYSHHVSGRGKN